MKILKEFKVTKVDDGGMSTFSLPEEIQKWIIENTMFRPQSNVNVIHPFRLCVMIPPTSFNNIKPDTSYEAKHCILVKNIAFKNDTGKWDVYEKAIFDIYNRKTVGEDSVKCVPDSIGSIFGSRPIANDWNVIIKTNEDVHPILCNLSLEELFDNLE